jgi:hypothetical protein
MINRINLTTVDPVLTIKQHRVLNARLSTVILEIVRSVP